MRRGKILWGLSEKTKSCHPAPIQLTDWNFILEFASLLRTDRWCFGEGLVLSRCHPGAQRWLCVSNRLSLQGSTSSWPHTSISRERSGTLSSRPTCPALWLSSCPRSPSGSTGSPSLPEQFLVSLGACGVSGQVRGERQAMGNCFVQIHSAEQFDACKELFASPSHPCLHHHFGGQVHHAPEPAPLALVAWGFTRQLAQANGAGEVWGPNTNVHAPCKETSWGSVGCCLTESFWLVTPVDGFSFPGMPY